MKREQWSDTISTISIPLLNKIVIWDFKAEALQQTRESKTDTLSHPIMLGTSHPANPSHPTRSHLQVGMSQTGYPSISLLSTDNKQGLGRVEGRLMGWLLPEGTADDRVN